MSLASAYHGYLDVLNERRWPALVDFVHDDVTHNDRPLGRAGYVEILEADVAAMPDLVFRVEELVVEADLVAARLWFDCHAVTDHFGPAVAGHRLRFAEHVFYRFDAGRIRTVRSLIDTAAIRAQVGLTG